MESLLSMSPCAGVQESTEGFQVELDEVSKVVKSAFHGWVYMQWNLR